MKTAGSSGSFFLPAFLIDLIQISMGKSLALDHGLVSVRHWT